jgi:hypothetical protein
MYTFNLMDYLRRHMHKKLPKEYVNDPRMHAQITLEQARATPIKREMSAHDSHAVRLGKE